MIINSILGSDRLHTWSKTFPQGHTTTQELVTADKWLKAHRNDEGLVLVIFTDSELSPPEAGNYYMYGFARNVRGATDSGYQLARSLASAGTFANYFPTEPVGSDTVPAIRYLQIDSNGTLRYGASSAYKIAPTTYKIYAFIM